MANLDWNILTLIVLIVFFSMGLSFVEFFSSTRSLSLICKTGAFYFYLIIELTINSLAAYALWGLEFANRNPVWTAFVATLCAIPILQRLTFQIGDQVIDLPLNPIIEKLRTHILQSIDSKAISIQVSRMQRVSRTLAAQFKGQESKLEADLQRALIHVQKLSAQDAQNYIADLKSVSQGKRGEIANLLASALAEIDINAAEYLAETDVDQQKDLPLAPRLSQKR